MISPYFYCQASGLIPIPDKNCFNFIRNWNCACPGRRQNSRFCKEQAGFASAVGSLRELTDEAGSDACLRLSKLQPLACEAGLAMLSLSVSRLRRATANARMKPATI
jgi:hypothetical protein